MKRKKITLADPIVKDQIKQNINTCWPFKVDETEAWAYWHPAFTPEECEKIIKIGKQKKLEKATISRGYEKDYRDSNISWINVETEHFWIFRKVTDIVTNLNSKFFNFDLYGLMEGFQFTHYKAPGGKYDKHVDSGKGHYIRKLSLSIQLSDPDSYEGGDFKLQTGSESTLLPKEQGKLILFPSYTLHEVTPVTKGERYSLVAWITGPQFK